MSSVIGLKVIKVRKTILSTILPSHSCSAMFAGFYCFKTSKLLFLLLVTLIHPADGILVAMGTVIIRNTVQGNAIKEDEASISAQKLLGYNALGHPEYQYDM